jgi:hypothetical protein
MSSLISYLYILDFDNKSCLWLYNYNINSSSKYTDVFSFLILLTLEIFIFPSFQQTVRVGSVVYNVPTPITPERCV